MFKAFTSSPNPDILIKYKKLRPEDELNILISFAFPGEQFRKMFTELKKDGVVNDVILDSGAYSINNSPDVYIDFSGYKSFCKKFSGEFFFVVNFDKNFTEYGYHENHQNQLQLDRICTNAVPVIHDYLKETLEVSKIANSEYQIVALGYHPVNKTEDNIKQLTQLFHDCGKKVHLLGKSEYAVAKSTNVDFIDSSNWAQATKFGYIYTFLPNSDEVKSIRFQDKSKKLHNVTHWHDYEHRDELQDYIYDNLKLDYKDLMANRTATESRYLVNILFLVEVQDRIRKYRQGLAAQNNSASQNPSSLPVSTLPSPSNHTP